MIDVDARRVEVRAAPAAGLYTTTEDVGEDGKLSPPGAAGVLRVADLLP